MRSMGEVRGRELQFQTAFDSPSSPAAVATGSSSAEAGDVEQHCVKAKESSCFCSVLARPVRRYAPGLSRYARTRAKSWANMASVSTPVFVL
jgi:hypothetical protein